MGDTHGAIMEPHGTPVLDTGSAKTKVFMTVPTPSLMNQEPGNSRLHQDDYGEKSKVA
jgi:hypothetical protein